MPMYMYVRFGQGLTDLYKSVPVHHFLNCMPAKDLMSEKAIICLLHFKFLNLVSMDITLHLCLSKEMCNSLHQLIQDHIPMDFHLLYLN